MMRGDRNSAHGAVQSLSAFDVQNRYGRRALSRLFELMRTKGADSTAGVAFSFVGPRRGRASTAGKRHWPSWVRFCDEASKALAGVGINLDTEDKYDESFRESHNLNVFLNRILMIFGPGAAERAVRRRGGDLRGAGGRGPGRRPLRRRAGVTGPPGLGPRLGDRGAPRGALRGP
ncbi:unnamed protein product [Prorocentrum cordatum]|uniref:Uncharacterized protein n=1 Tax=Prorocentrum cordatum TaxID=2364126 RepID=A0ABN9PIV4_9DINO|nr:unnamed protein product [Polarella glacialis]